MVDHDRFPAGEYRSPEVIDAKALLPEMDRLALFPSILRQTVEPLNETQLNTRTLPDVWTVKQIIHHLADSHSNGIIRTKLALTEENPTIKPYAEQRWAELKDNDLPVSISLSLLDGIHAKWSHLFKSLETDELMRTYFHPADSASVPIGEQLCLYVHHGNHHLGFITQLLKARGWITPE